MSSVVQGRRLQKKGQTSNKKTHQPGVNSVSDLWEGASAVGITGIFLLNVPHHGWGQRKFYTLDRIKWPYIAFVSDFN